jgi:rhomboid protease GluP
MGSYPPTPQPEILPPDGSYAPPAQAEPPLRRPRPSWATSPATYLLIGINCLVFVAMVAHHVSAGSPTTDQLMLWGADNAGAVLVYGQWWRIVTAMFVHVGFLHLATNMWCLWNLGLLAEPLVGSWGLLLVYVLTGAAGNLLSTLQNWRESYPYLLELARASHGQIPAAQVLGLFPAGAGASGAVFGIAGALIVLLKSNRLPVPPVELNKLRKSVIYFAAINLVIGFSISFGAERLGSGLRIDNMAHLGGFMCGLLFAVPMVPRFCSPRPLFLKKLRRAVGMIAGLLVLFGFFLAQLPG